MTAQYDWSKLPNGWRYYKHERYGDEFLMSPSGGSYNLIDVRYSSQFPIALAILETCRIPEPSTPPDTATVTALRAVEGENGDIIVTKGGTVRTLHTQPADEYDWSKLEGSGWSYDSTFDTIEKPIGSGLTWRYWPRTGLFSAQLKMGVKPDAESAKTAYLEAYALVAKCKRDWQDEVRQACEGLRGFTIEWHASPDQRAILWWEVNVPSDGLTLTAKRTYRVHCHTTNAESLLTMSIIIERLKKLGWREA